LSAELLVYADAIVGFNGIKEQVANIPDTMFNIYRISLFGYASLVVLRVLRLAFDGMAWSILILWYLTIQSGSSSLYDC
jgi:hypothetical protein